MVEALALADPQAWTSLLTLTRLELVLGVDNIVFIAIMTRRVPEPQRPLAYRLGRVQALVSRLALLGTLSWVLGLTKPRFDVFGHAIGGREIILVGGGLFLIGKATHEIYEQMEVETADGRRSH